MLAYWHQSKHTDARHRSGGQRITWHLTGYTWSDAHLAQVAGILAGLPESGEATSWTVTQTETDTYTFQAVRLCFASPYGLLR